MNHNNYYEILGVAPHVGLGQIQSAYRFSKTLYSGESMASYGLLDTAERERMLAQVEEAYAVLADANSRRAYDLQLNAGAAQTEGQAIATAASEAPRRDRARTEPSRAVSPLPRARSQSAPASAPSQPAVVDPPEPALPVPPTVNGAALRSLREQRGLTIDQIAALSKVGGRFLRALEDDRHEVLPGRVFARGFLIEYARAVRVSETELVDRYLQRWTGR